MRTEVVKVTAGDSKIINKAAELIKSGELVAFPTETVYGLGANAFNNEACKKIYEVKKRPDNKPLSLLVSDVAMIENISEVPELARILIDTFMPGPLTLILPSKDKNHSVGVRMPDNEITLALIRAAGCPIAAPSANISDQPPPTTAQEVFKYFNGKIPLILDGGECKFGLSSTIVDLSDGKPKILRKGAISDDDIFRRMSM